MKANFEKWLIEHQDQDTVKQGFEIVNQFATDFAEKEAIEFLRWDDKISGIVRHDVDYENKYKEYAK